MHGHEAEFGGHGDSVHHVPTPFTRDQLSPAMQERYGLDRRPIGRWIAVAALVLAFVAALAFVAVGVTRSPVQSRLISWDDVAADRVDMTIEVRRPAADEVQCVLRAQDSKRIDVGYAVVVIPAGGEVHARLLPADDRPRLHGGAARLHRRRAGRRPSAPVPARRGAHRRSPGRESVRSRRIPSRNPRVGRTVGR